VAIPVPLLARLERQLDALGLVLERATPGALEARPPSGDWSAREHLAHLARHHADFLERLRRLLAEPTPVLGRYRAESDPEWPAWSGLPLDEVLRRLRALRTELVTLVRAIPPSEDARSGIHPAFGEMDVTAWLEFFLLHEAHHLYSALVRVGEARRAPR
jgi:phytoene dehydrogenase-like protein